MPKKTTTEHLKEKATPISVGVLIVWTVMQQLGITSDDVKGLFKRDITKTSQAIKEMDDRLRTVEKEVYLLKELENRRSEKNWLGKVLGSEVKPAEIPIKEFKPAPKLELPMQQKVLGE